MVRNRYTSIAATTSPFGPPNATSAPAVTIKNIEKHIIDHAFEAGWVAPQVAPRRTGKSIAVVGSGMRGIKGVAAKVFGAVARKGVNVIMIAQGSSELNLAFVVNDSDCEQAVRALHDEFGLGNGRRSSGNSKVKA